MKIWERIQGDSKNLYISKSEVERLLTLAGNKMSGLRVYLQNIQIIIRTPTQIILQITKEEIL